MNRAAAAAGTIGLVIGLVAGGVGGHLLDDGSNELTAEEKRPTTTVAIERRDLNVTESATGELASSSEQALTTIGSGTITTAAEVGATIDRGGQIARVDDVPTTILFGNQPVWRAFKSSMTDGTDVLQLEMNLRALGFDPKSMTLDDHFDSDTGAAIKAWETSLGAAEPDDVLDAGQVIFAPTALQVTAAVAAGTRLAPGAELATVRPIDGSGLKLIFTVTEEAERYQPGQQVSIVLTDESEHPATITSFERVASTGGQLGGGGQTASFTVTATPDQEAGGLTAGPVSVEIPTDSATGALAVPSRALVAVTEGGQAVRLAQGDRLVAVNVGVFSDGWVEITGDEIAEGTMVVVPA